MFPRHRCSGPRTPRRTSFSIGPGSNGTCSCPAAGSAQPRWTGHGPSPRPSCRPTSIAPTVAYAGDAQFAPIETTDLSYATNTTDTVIAVGEQYFLLQDGVWFVSDSPNSPWQLAREVPDAIYAIPPSSPVYNVTY